MITVENGQVYETTEIVTATQTAIVTTCKCAEHKLSMSAVGGLINIAYKDWQDNPVAFNGEVALRIADTLNNTASKAKVMLVDGVGSYQLTGSSDYQITASVDGADGDSIYIEM